MLSLSDFRLARSSSLSIGGGQPRWRGEAIMGNKATANQSPLLKLFYEKSHSKRTSTRQQLDCAKTLITMQSRIPSNSDFCRSFNM